MTNFNVHDFRDAILSRCNQTRESLLGPSKPYLFIPCKSGKPKALAVAHCDTVFSEIAPPPKPPTKKKHKKSLLTKASEFVNGKSNYLNDDAYNDVYQGKSYSNYGGYYGYCDDLEPAYIRGEHEIVSGALDDRLGVSIIMDILPTIMPDFEYDILLTDDEETGNSTAHDFCEDVLSGLYPQLTDVHQNYQFIFQFDRAGVDAVTYQFKNYRAENLLEDTGWVHGNGSFTDICKLRNLGIWACNFGCGYHNQHSLDCYVDLRELDINLRRFAYFVDCMGSQRFLNNVSRPVQTWSKYTYSNNYKPTPPTTKGLIDPNKDSVHDDNDTVIELVETETEIISAPTIKTKTAAIKLAKLLNIDWTIASTVKVGYVRLEFAGIAVRGTQVKEFIDAWLQENKPEVSNDESGIIVEDSPFYVDDPSSEGWDKEAWADYMSQLDDEDIRLGYSSDDDEIIEEMSLLEIDDSDDVGYDDATQVS
jgi:hypothetical protein